MHTHRNVLMIQSTAIAAVVTALLTGGCVHVGNWSSWDSGTRISHSVRNDVVHDLESRVVERTVALDPDQTVHIRHLAGRVTVEQADVEQAQLRATVYAHHTGALATEQLLNDMQWTTRQDRNGGDFWTLNWPTDRYQKFHYSRNMQDDTTAQGFEVTTDTFNDRWITVTTQRGGGAPTLFADLTVTYPAGSHLTLRTLAGAVNGGSLTGDVSIETALGAVTIDAVNGETTIDTSASDIQVGELVGRALLDTGSGNINVTRMDGRGTFDTGSGNITVGALAGRGHFDTGSGDIWIQSIESDNIYADTGSGDITIENGRANHVVADTGSGNIRLDSVEFHGFRGDTGSGDIFIRSSLMNARSIEADTGSGDVVIDGGGGASFDLTADLGSGRVTNGYGNVTYTYDDEEIIGVRHGSGGTRIHVDTGSGDCVIRPQQPAAADTN